MANIYGNPLPNAGMLSPKQDLNMYMEMERIRHMSEMQQIHPSPTDMLIQRFRYCNAKMDNAPLPFEFLQAVRPKDDSAGAVDGMIIMVIKDGKPLVLRDDMALFPSDTLIAQLRML
jgi:hypothetical protein